MISPQFFMLFRVYMERIDPQWRRRWDKRPQKEFQSAVEVMRRFFDRPEEHIQPGDGEELLAAAMAWKENSRTKRTRTVRRSGSLCSTPGKGSSSTPAKATS